MANVTEKQEDLLPDELGKLHFEGVEVRALLHHREGSEQYERLMNHLWDQYWVVSEERTLAGSRIVALEDDVLLQGACHTAEMLVSRLLSVEWDIRNAVGGERWHGYVDASLILEYRGERFVFSRYRQR
jgi:hypothetical protein